MIGIYKLVFKDLDWVYVGQSSNIDLRYKAHLRSLEKGLGNIKIKEAYNMCGAPELAVLEECKEEDLNNREVYWIDKLDSFNNGLNASKGGDIYAGKGLSHYNSKYSREQILKSLTLLKDVSLSYKDISDITGVSAQTIYSVRKGNSHQWVLEEFPELLEEISEVSRVKSGYDHHKSKFTKEQLIYSFKLLTDPGLTLDNIEEITGVSKNQLNAISTGRSHIWLQEELPAEYAIIQSKRDKYANIISPEGKEYLVISIAEFVKEMGEDKTFASGIGSVINGRSKQYKGWRLKGTEIEEYYITKDSTVHKVTPALLQDLSISRQSFHALKTGKQKTTKGFRLATKDEISALLGDEKN